MSACFPARSGFYRSYHEIICRSQQISARSLSGPLINLYPLKNQCRISLIGSASPAAQNATRWQYEVVMPLMLIGQDRAERTEMHLLQNWLRRFPKKPCALAVSSAVNAIYFPAARSKRLRASIVSPSTLASLYILPCFA